MSYRKQWKVEGLNHCYWNYESEYMNLVRVYVNNAIIISCNENIGKVLLSNKNTKIFL